MDDNRELISKLCNLEIPGDIRISPSGGRVLYSTGLTWGHCKRRLPVSTLWLATFGEANSSRQITDGKSRDHSLAWHPEGEKFAFISDRAGNVTKSAIYTMSVTDLSKAVPVTPIENEQTIEKFEFSPDGKQIAFISKDEKTKEERQREEKQEDVQVWGQGPRYSRLRIIDLRTSQISTLALDKQILDFCWIPARSKEHSEQQIAFVSCHKTSLEHPYRFGSDIHLVATDLKAPRKVCSFPNRPNDLCWRPGNDPDRDELYFWSGAPPEYQNFRGNVLYKVSTEEEAQYEQVLFEADLNITNARSVHDQIAAKAQHRLEDCVIQVGSGILYSCKQEIEAYDIAYELEDGQAKLAIATSDINHPVEVYSVERAGGKLVQLSQHGKSFEGHTFGNCTILSCLTTDDYKIEIDGVYLEPVSEPESDSKLVRRPYPTIVLIQGGPNMRVTNAFNAIYYMWTPYLLSLGYGILLPNYRGCSSRGREFASFSYDGVGVHACADIVALTQCAIEKGYADPRRLVVGGYSHGGLLTNLCALRNGLHGHGWNFKAAISGASISDIDAMSFSSDTGMVYQAELHNGALPWAMHPSDTSTRKASALWAFQEAMERSKSSGIPIIPPILILHGANDERCPVTQAWGMQRALEHYSLPFEMAIYPRQGHIFHEQYFWIDMAVRIGRWIERYIGPTAAI